jgi:hypothetical protein
MNLHDATLEKNKDLIKFKIQYDRDNLEDIMSYNEILDYIECEHNSEDGPLWQFRRLLAHQHTPLGHPDQNGSHYNVKVEWETGYQLPNNHEHALKLDRLAGNTKWADANDIEHKQLLEYKVFIDKGKFIESNIPKGYRQI